MSIIIRTGEKRDVPHALALVKELAEYEKAPHEVETTVEQMLEDGFGERPVYGMFVAEREGNIVGIAIYYYRYSTWKGKRLYLEDLVVTESLRGQRIGKLLFDKVVEKALEDNCNGMTWQVLDWNEPAFNFYKKYNAAMDPGWVNGSLSCQQLRELCGK